MRWKQAVTQLYFSHLHLRAWWGLKHNFQRNIKYYNTALLNAVEHSVHLHGPSNFRWLIIFQ